MNKNSRVVFISSNTQRKGMRNINKRLKELGVNTIIPKNKNSRFKPKDNDLNVFWGCVPSQRFSLSNSCMFKLNNHYTNQLAFNKYSLLNNISYGVPYTTNYSTACNWLSSGHIVVCRELLESSQGRGIVMAKKPCELSQFTKMYTKYMDIDKEYRVHIVNYNGVLRVLCQRKIYKGDNIEVPLVRNKANDFKFINNYTIGENNVIKILEVTYNVLNNINFGICSIDIVKSNGSYYVLEVNTATGVNANKVINFYADSIKDIIEGNFNDSKFIQGENKYDISRDKVTL